MKVLFTNCDFVNDDGLCVDYDTLIFNSMKEFLEKIKELPFRWVKLEYTCVTIGKLYVQSDILTPCIEVWDRVVPFIPGNEIDEGIKYIYESFDNNGNISHDYFLDLRGNLPDLLPEISILNINKEG